MCGVVTSEYHQFDAPAIRFKLIRSAVLHVNNVAYVSGHVGGLVASTGDSGRSDDSLNQSTFGHPLGAMSLQYVSNFVSQHASEATFVAVRVVPFIKWIG